MTDAIAYFRTSSKSGVGDDKDSETRQRAAIERYAAENGIEIVREFYDAAVSGADQITDRKGFNSLMDFISESGTKIILVETVNRFARDVLVQLMGYQLLKKHEIVLIPVDDPDHFENIEDNPMAEAIMIIMATLSMLEKKMLCKRMRSGIEKKRRENGRCEGRKPAPSEVINMAKALRGEGKSLRMIGDELGRHGHTVFKTVIEKVGSEEVRRRVPTGCIYKPQSIKAMLGYKDR